MLLTKQFLMVIALIVAGLFLASCSSDSDNATGPTVVSLSPANNATGVKPNPILAIKFDRKVYVEHGNITIKKKVDDSTVAVIDVTGEQVEGSGTNIIMIYPVASIMSANGYYILIDGTAFADEYGLYFAGINDPSAWNFSTVIATSPAGPKALIEAMAQEQGTDAETFWNTVLFDNKKYLDGFCSSGSISETATEVQKYYFDTFCTEESVNYFSYQKFIIADEKMEYYMKDKYTFLREAGTDKKARIRNFCNFLATGAQETTSALAGYTNDGFYWRWEYGGLVKCCSEAELGNNIAWACIEPSNVCDLATYTYTAYTPGIGYKVAVRQDDKSQVWTHKSWNTVTDKAGNEMDLAASPNKQVWNNNITLPDDYTFVNLNEVIEPYYWVGMGAIQLTADSVMNFFGWYYNNLAESPKESADLNAFVESLAADGKLSFLGALWYWNYRVNGTDKPTIEKVLNYYEGKGEESPCHDIAISTILVNGGCNDFDKRKDYYDYFTETAFWTKIVPVTVTFDGVVLNSMECDNITKFQEYCTESVFK